MSQSRLTGAFELEATLKELGAEVKNKVTRSSLRKASKVLTAQIEQNLSALDDPSSSERIYANVRAQWGSKRFKSQGVPNFRIGILGGARSAEKNAQNPGGDTFYWRFLEFGTERVRGKFPITNAISQKEGAALAAFRADLAKAVPRAAKRIAKKRAGRSRAQQARRDFFGLEDT